MYVAKRLHFVNGLKQRTAPSKKQMAVRAFVQSIRRYCRFKISEKHLRHIGLAKAGRHRMTSPSQERTHRRQ